MEKTTTTQKPPDNNGNLRFFDPTAVGSDLVSWFIIGTIVLLIPRLGGFLIGKIIRAVKHELVKDRQIQEFGTGLKNALASIRDSIDTLSDRVDRTNQQLVKIDERVYKLEHRISVQERIVPPIQEAIEAKLDRQDTVLILYGQKIAVVEQNAREIANFLSKTTDFQLRESDGSDELNTSESGDLSL